jgi:hypothetical protein
MIGERVRWKPHRRNNLHLDAGVRGKRKRLSLHEAAERRPGVVRE